MAPMSRRRSVVWLAACSGGGVRIEFRSGQRTSLIEDAAMVATLARQLAQVVVILGTFGVLGGLFDLPHLSDSSLAAAQQGKDKDKDKGPKPPKPPKPPKGGGGGDPPGPSARWKMDEG